MDEVNQACVCVRGGGQAQQAGRHESRGRTFVGVGCLRCAGAALLS